VGSNETGGLLGLAASLTGSSSSTSIIIGSVALGVVGLAAIGGAVAYFRGGGTAAGFMNKVKEQKGALTQFANALPISEEQKAKLTGAIADPTSLIPEAQRAQLEQAKAKLEELKGKALEKVEELKGQALQAQDSILQVLPSSVADAVRAKEAEMLAPLQAQVQAQIQAKQAELQQLVNSYVPTPVASILSATVAPAAPAAPAVVDLTSVAPAVVEAPVAATGTAIAEVAATATAVPEAPAVHITVNAEDVKAIQEFLAEKAKAASDA